MANNQGTLVTDTVRPFSDQDTFPVAYSNEIQGGLKSVATLTDRNIIPAERLQQGTIVFVAETGFFYKYINTSWVQLSKTDIQLDQVDNTSDLNKPISIATQTALDQKVSYIEYVNGAKALGPYNASTNIPALTATPDPALYDGDYYDITESGPLGFAGSNFTAGTISNKGDRLKKKGNQWYLVPLEFESFYSIISQTYFADTKPSVIAAGSVLTNPNSLTCYIAPAGTYTVPAGTITLSGNLNLIFWDFDSGWTYTSFDVAVKDNTVSTSKIVDGAVTTAKIADKSITTAKITDKAVTTDKADFFAISKNLYNPADADVVDNYFLENNGLPTRESSSFKTTGFIPVNEGEVIVQGNNGVQQNVRFIHSYDVSKARISGGEDTTRTSYTVPTNAKYVRVSFAKTNTFFQINKTSIQLYDAYGATLLPQYGGNNNNTLFLNDICLPSKLYMLTGVQQDMFSQAILKREREKEIVRFSGTVSYSRRLKKVASVTNPTNNATIQLDLLDNENFSTLKTKTSIIQTATPSTGTAETVISVIGDSWTNGAFWADAFFTKGYVPNLKMIGLRKQVGRTQYDEGRGGWTLAKYFAINKTETDFAPFMQPSGSFYYYGGTGFWINAWKVFRGTAGSGFEPAYSASRYDTYLSLFNEATGYLNTPVEGCIMYDNIQATYKIYTSGSWINTTEGAYTWSFDYTKYLSMWSLSTPNILFVLLGLNDFRDVANIETIDFATWNTRINTMKTSFLTANPTGKFAVCIPSTSCGISDNEGGYDTLKQNAAMWNARKNIIDNFDNKEGEGVYLIDTGICVDNEFGYNFSTNETYTKPFGEYTGSSRIAVQTGNPHPYNSYKYVGIPLAAFIQKYR